MSVTVRIFTRPSISFERARGCVPPTIPLSLRRPMSYRFLLSHLSAGLLVALSGCQAVPVVNEVVSIVSKPFTAEPVTPQPKPEPRPVDTITAFAASAAPGENANLLDPDTGRQLRVSAGRLFHSAGGQRCRYLILIDAKNRKTREIACEVTDGEWQRSTAVATTARRRNSSTPRSQ